MNAKPTTALASRREKIAQAGSTVFVAVAVAAVIVMFSAVSLRFLWEQKTYNDRVNQKKSQARDQLNTNLANLDKLSGQFAGLETSASTNSKTILHALPPVYDYAGLATSVESLAQRSGVTSSGSVGQDISATAVKNSSISQPQEVPVAIEVTGSYDAVRSFVQNLEKSIRPFNVTAIQLSGSNGNLKAQITATTYYQPLRNLDVTKEQIK